MAALHPLNLGPSSEGVRTHHRWHARTTRLCSTSIAPSVCIDWCIRLWINPAPRYDSSGRSEKGSDGIFPATMHLNWRHIRTLTSHSILCLHLSPDQLIVNKRTYPSVRLSPLRIWTPKSHRLESRIHDRLCHTLRCPPSHFVILSHRLAMHSTHVG